MDKAQAALPIGTQIEMQEGELLQGEEQLEEDSESSSSGLHTETSVSDGSTEQPQESSSSSDDEDVTIDEVMHLPPEQLQSLGVRESLGLLNGDRGILEADEDRESRVEPLEEAATSGSDSNPSLGDEDGQNRAPEGVTNVAYRAIDEGLVVIGERELHILLPGWSLEEVGSILLSIQRGDWTYFHEVMTGASGAHYHEGQVSEGNQHLPPGEIAYGLLEGQQAAWEPQTVENPEQSDLVPESGKLDVETDSGDSEDIPPLEYLPDSEPNEARACLEATLWMGIVCVLTLGSLVVLGAVGLFSGHVPGVSTSQQGSNSERQQIPVPSHNEPMFQGLSMGSVVAWVASGWHRLGVIVSGFDAQRDALVVFVPGTIRPAWVPCSDLRWYVWVFLVVVFGLCSSGEAVEVQAEDSGALVDYHFGMCWERYAPGENRMGSGLQVPEMLTVIVIWETCKWMVCRMCRSRRSISTAGSQTTNANLVFLPLEPGMPNRAPILFSLWQAGHEVDLEEYPLEIQEEYCSYLGSHLRRRAMDEGDSD